MDPVSNLERVLNDAHAMIATVSAGDVSKPTPCTDWDVKGLTDHMIGVVQRFGAFFAAAPATAPADQSSDPSGAYRQAMDGLLQAARAPGALDKTLSLPFGEMPGRQALGIVIGDQSIHTCDLAKALGKPFTMDEGIASATLGVLHQLITADRRGPGKGFAEEVSCPADAPAQDRLLAFSGRQP